MNALTSYGSTKLSSDQAQELISQVRYLVDSAFLSSMSILLTLVDCTTSMLIFQLEPDAAGNINYVDYVNM